MEKRSEKRAVPRRSYSHQVGFEWRHMKVSQWESVLAQGRGVDVSSGGLGLLTNTPVTTGDVVRITIPLDLPQTNIPVFSEVRWARQEDDHYRVGLLFLS